MNKTYSEPLELNEEQQLRLLRLARLTIEQAISAGSMPLVNENDPCLLQQSAVFVTLWEPHGSEPNEGETMQLRGCIGSLQADLPLYLAVQKSAVSAATRDPRFAPIQPDDLDTLNIEIAVLSALEKVEDLEEIIIGRDGIVIEAMGRRGLLLPKVATRLHWDRQEFLKNVCLKAGLPSGIWPDHGTLYRFRTTEFQEKSRRA